MMGWFSKKEQPVDERAAAGSGLRFYIQKMDSAGVRAALTAGADPNGSKNDDISPLVLAATSFVSSLPTHRRAQKDILMSLLDAGADPQWGGRNGQSPFEVAVKRGWEDIIGLMVAKGHPLESIDGSVLTPIQVALSPVDYRGHSLISTVQTLIALGADVNNAGKTSRPPLLFALQQSENLRKGDDYEDLVKTLIEEGASLDAVSPQGHSVRDLLEKNGLEHLAN